MLQLAHSLSTALTHCEPRVNPQQHLASFDHDECHLPIVVPANDVAALEAAFAQAEADNVHIEALYMEPVRQVCCL